MDGGGRMNVLRHSSLKFGRATSNFKHEALLLTIFYALDFRKAEIPHRNPHNRQTRATEGTGVPSSPSLYD